MGNNSKVQAPVVNANEVSRISIGTVIKGSIVSPNDLRIDGEFEGRIQSQGRVVIGEKAVIKGDIFCENADLWGHVSGRLYVKDTLTLKNVSVVAAELHTCQLVVELDAQFEGTCYKLDAEEFEKLSQADIARPVKEASEKAE